MNNKLVLIDGHSILNRAFYGVPDLSNLAGLHTNAIYGFLNIMFKVLEEEKATHLVVAFDVKEPTFRHEIYKEYKGTRKPMPEELREQVPVMKELLTAMGITIVQQPGLEADDIIGTLARRAESLGYAVTLLSGDRDLLQLVTEDVKMRMPRTKGGKTEMEDFYSKDVIEKYQVTPEQIIELKALMGDASDNIPGVPKVGEKTATALIVEYGNIENVYAHAADISKKSIRETIETNYELAKLSKILATIQTSGEFSCNIPEAKLSNPYTEAAYVLMKQLEFKNFLPRFEGDMTSNQEQSAHFQEVSALEDVEAAFLSCEKEQVVGIAIIEGDDGSGTIVGVAIAYKNNKCYLIKTEGFVTEAYLIDKVNRLFDMNERVIAGFGIKRQLKHLNPHHAGQLFDIGIAAYLLNPLKNDYEIEDIANEYLDMMIQGKKEIFGKLSLYMAAAEKPEEFLNYACFLSLVALLSKSVLEEKLEETEMKDLFWKIEMPLCLCLYEMEQQGIAVRPDELKVYGEQLVGRIEELEKNIQLQAGEEFNINSPKQLGEILFEKMNLPGSKKTKTGYSTAADVLEKLALDYPFVADILEYRGLTKLKSTYADGLATCIKEDGRIHSTFNQTITATGRISSTEPNLQNIPVRMELGRLIRKVFVPKEGCIFVDADYSQIELRILAHMSDDKKLIAAYNEEQDIHRMTASEVFHTPFDQVTEQQRRNAKAVNFGIVYGISSFGLSQDLSISRKEAKEYIDKYFETYPQIKVFLEKLVEDAKENGYAVTLFGRKRPVPELKSSNFMQRSFGERVAMNAPIQGTAADIMKIAMIRVYDRMKREGLKSQLILQVHDELLIETVKEEETVVKSILAEEMLGAAKMSVKLEIDMHTGKNWYEAK